MSTTTLPQVGSQVTIGKREYEVIRHGCATRWPDCPHGELALTVQRVGAARGTECVSADTLHSRLIHDSCRTCGGVGWIVVGRTIDWPHGYQIQCPDCDACGECPSIRACAAGATPVCRCP